MNNLSSNKAYSTIVPIIFIAFLFQMSSVCSFELGLHMDITWYKNSSIRANSILNAKAISTMISRNSLLWHLVEPTKGIYDWSIPDSVVDELLEAKIEPLFCIYGSPSWANSIPSSTSNYYLYVPTEEAKFQEWLSNYVSFAKAAVTRYRGKVKKWELWNEENEHFFWKPKPNINQYVRWFQAIQEAIKSVDPAAEIALGGLAGLSCSGVQDYNGKTFLALLYQKSLSPDIVAIHPYSKSAPNVHIQWENNFDDIALIRQVMLAYGQQNKKIWITEWGWPTNTMNQQIQADWLRLSLQLIKTQYTYVSVATYFLDYDRPPTYYHGLFTSNFLPKLAANIFGEFAGMLSKATTAPKNLCIISQ